jgi:hypothetical protein
MTNDNQFYVVMKLTSGEQVMAVLQEEDEEHIMIENPMVMKTVISLEEGKEHITASPLCAFTDEQSFILPKRNILFIKKLHHVFVQHYKRIVADNLESTLFTPRDSEEELRWEDDHTSLEPSQQESVEEVNWEEKLKNFVPGNETLN